MKGLLTGDITSNMIISIKSILEKYLKDIEVMENDISQLGMNPNEFYNNFFQIDLQFLKNNTAKNISLNLSKHFQNQGILTKKLLYYVNLKHTQFYDLLKHNVAVSSKEDFTKTELEEATNIINNKKLYFQSILNDLYNEIVDSTVVNKLKTPFYGIPYPEKENIHNSFRRQLFIEEGCFENANTDFTKIFSSLQR